MLKNKIINMGLVKKVATALGELNDQVAYVGGATVSTYADDPAAEEFVLPRTLTLCSTSFHLPSLLPYRRRWHRKESFPMPSQKSIAVLNMMMCLLMSCQRKRWDGHLPRRRIMDPFFVARC